MMAFALLAGAASAACVGGAAPARAETIHFGMSAAFTGPTRGLGIEYYRGLLACFNRVNARGGVNGRPLAVTALDDGYDPDPCVSNTIRLVEQEKVFALLNYVGTPTTTRMLPLLLRFETRDVYLLFPFSGAEALRGPPYGGLVYNLRASYFDETEGLVGRLVDAGRTRIAVFYQADAYGRNGWDGVRRALERRGLAMTGEAAYNRGDPYARDYGPEVRLLAASKPDAVVLVGSYAASAGFIRDARELGLDVPLCPVSFADPDNMVRLLSTESERSGRNYLRGVVFSQVAPSYEDVTLPAVRAYRADMDRYATMPPEALLREPYAPHRYSAVSFEGYLNGLIVVEMLGRMGDDPEPGRIPEAMAALDGFDLGMGEDLDFAPGCNQGLHGVHYTVVREGRLVPLRSWREFVR
jgi:ABC-type branched-subunit amino acid transport system substrate-binding protein